MTAAAGVLQGNLFPVADSDFEVSLTGNWAGGTNCSLSTSTSHPFTGAKSLRAAAAAAGTLTFTYAPIPVALLESQGLTLSWWAYATSTGITAQVTGVFKSAGGSTVATDVLTSYSLVNGAFSPAADTLAVPSNAAFLDLTMTVTGSGASQGTYFDLFYCAPVLWQALIAWPSNPLAAVQQWADMTPWVREDKGISHAHGRQDETGQVQAGSHNYTLDNTTGWFAQGNTGSPFQTVTLGKRSRLLAADETGTFHVRSDCTITDLPVTTPAPGAQVSFVTVAAQDLMAWLGRDQSMRTMIEEDQLLDGPICQYVLADAANSATAVDSSGNGAAPLEYVTTGGGASVAFGSGTGIIGFAAPGFTSSPLSCPKWTAASAEAAVLQGYLPVPVSAAGGGHFEIWYDLGSTGGANYTMFSLVNSRTRAQLQVGWTDPQGGHGLSLFWIPAFYDTSTASAQSGTVPTTGQLYLVLNGTSATLYVDNASVCSVTIPAGQTFDFVMIGGSSLNLSSITGSLSAFAAYDYVLPSLRMAAHYAAGANQKWGTKIGTLITDILNYAGIPSGLQNVGNTTSFADAYEISGQSPLGMIQVYQQADGGVFYCSSGGVLTWQPRVSRYAAQSSPALVLAAGQYEPPLPIGPTTQFMATRATLGNTNIPGGVTSVNTAAEAQSGVYPQGDPSSPTTGPWYSYPWQPAAGTAVPDSDVLQDAADWITNIYGTPVPRSPSVTMDLATLKSPFSRATAYGVDTGSVVELQGLPASSVGGTRVNFLMTEGLSESYSRSGGQMSWTLVLNTSPASQSAAWLAGDAAMGVLDSTAVVGLGTDGNVQSGTQYVGPPYVVPSFSSTMNVTGNVGANDMRGLAYNVQQEVTPPVFGLQQVSSGQSIINNAATDLQWDNVWYDTQNGFSLNTPTIYTVRVAGLYDLMATVPFAPNATGDRRAYFEQNGAEVAGRESIAAVVGADYVSLAISATVDCQIGDTLKVTCFQNSGGSLAIPTTNGGACFSGVWNGN